MNTYTEETIEIAHSWKAGKTITITKHDYIKEFTDHLNQLSGLMYGTNRINESYFKAFNNFKEITEFRAEEMFDSIYKKQS